MAKMLRIGVTSKVYRPDILKLTGDIISHLDGKCTLVLKKELAKKTNFKGLTIDWKRPQLDIIISLGGDGTVLQTVGQMSGTKTPVLGIKRGGKGFLSEIEEGVEEGLDRLLRKDYEIEERMKLDVLLNGEKIGEALNDIVVSTAAPGKIQHFSLDINGETIESVSADGIIVATPTGSTAYSLSAGGPVVEPTLDAYEITPICPFRLNPRSMVVPAGAITDIRIIKDRRGLLILDGVTKGTITRSDTVRVVKSASRARLVKFHKNYFLKKIRRLLS